MAFWRISLLALVLIVFPYPVTVSAEDASPSGNHLAGNPLIGTWRFADTRWRSGPAEVTFITFRPDGRYQVRIYNARLPRPANGPHVITGAYEITGPGRFVFRPQETFTCPTGSDCVPHPGSAREPQAISFRFDCPDRLVDGEGTIWRRVR